MDGFVILGQFVLRLSFGLAVGMALTPTRSVTSGYYRNHSYVLLGLNVLAALAAASNPERFSPWLPIAAAVLSYLSVVSWLYEKAGPGLLSLWLIAGCSLAGAWQLQTGTWSADVTAAQQILGYADPATSGLVLGVTIAAMFLGHWYLNSPTMELAPLRRLVVLMGMVLAIRALVSGSGFFLVVSESGLPGVRQAMIIGLRWLSGLLGTGLIVGMTWQTLKIPNTQAATGLLYVGVIATFLGELTSQLLSQDSLFPL